MGEVAPCHQPVGLIDLFPTLVDLTGVSPVEGLEGQSLKPLIEQPHREWTRPAITTLAPGNHSLRARDWHYIRYADDSEELYDHRNDPHEWTDLAAKPESSRLLAKFRKEVPQKNRAAIVGDWKNWEIEAWQTAEKNAASRRQE